MDRGLFLLNIFATFLSARLLYVLVHEFGHALPALIFTRDDVKITIGPHEDVSTLLKFRIKRLQIRFTRNPFKWYRGSCEQELSESAFYQSILIILGGALTGLFLGALSIYLAPVLPVPLLFLIFGVFGILGLGNLIPRYLKGAITHNDGALILTLIRKKDYYAEWVAARKHYHKEQYEEVATICEDLLIHDIRDEEIYRLALAAYVMRENYQRAHELYRVFEKRFEMMGEDWAASGTIRLKLGDYEEGLADLDEALVINGRNANALNNRGYILNLLERYSEAIEDFDMAIEIEPDAAFPYNNRGLAKIKLGMEEEGLADIDHSLGLDAGNSYAHRNLGIYHFDRGELDRALELFEKARELDASTHLVDEYIERARGR